MSGPAGHIATSTSCKLPQWQNCGSGSWTGSYVESAVWIVIFMLSVSSILTHLSWKPHMPRLAAWSRQLPSPVVARGQSL